MTDSLDDELKALLEAASVPVAKDKKTRALNEVETWIAAIGAAPGNHAFTSMQLWLAYLKWSLRPLQQRKFFMQLKEALYDCRKISKYSAVYMLNPSSFDTSDEALRELNVKLRELNKIRQNAKKKNL